MFKYIAKYCSKAEKKIELYEVLVCNLFLYIFYCMSFMSFVLHFINKLIDEWDWIVQEVCYHFLNLFLVEDSCVVLDIDCRLLSRCIRFAIINEEGIYETISMYEKYMVCDVSWAESSYFHVFIYVNIKCIL